MIEGVSLGGAWVTDLEGADTMECPMGVPWVDPTGGPTELICPIESMGC